ncbi:hypothetical protein D3C87_2114910 [compost metagenome]
MLFCVRGTETLGELWFQLKLACVFAMTALHGAIAATIGSLRRGTISSARIRVLQLAGFALTATIVSLAVIK